MTGGRRSLRATDSWQAFYGLLAQYFVYLQGNGLIKVEDGEAKATDLTAGFLQYLARWNYGEEGRIL